MIDAEYCRIMARYNRWMNARLYELCAKIPDRDRRQDRGAFFRSIHGTLNHLLYGDLAWLSRLTGDPPEIPPLGQELYPDFDELKAVREALDNRLVDWSVSLSQERLRTPFTYTSKVDGLVRTLPTWAVVVHLFNHQIHHRGQLTTLLMQLGHDPGVTDLPFMPGLAEVSREQTSAG
jgi:uncharacterized damage-inducible protein DinB